uniref:Mitochondrial glutathione transporter SLC25A39 n=1 Tax=Hucho hucho TaxID=62062 RepID=A0A4W5K2L2_9TELE
MVERPVVTPSAGITPVQQMLASGTGALLTSVFVTPLDVVKIRLQAQQTPFYQGKCYLYCNGLMDHIYVCQNGAGCTSWYKTPTHFSGTLMYNNVIITLLPSVTYCVCCCPSSVDSPVSVCSPVGAVSVISPLELVRTKMQSRKVTYSELRVCILSSVAQDGWLSLWRGWGPTVLRDVPFSALYWFNYELVKAHLCDKYNVSQATFSISFTAGAISGAVAAIMTLPFDVVKTRRQIQLGEMETLGVPVKNPTSTWYIMRGIWTESGYRGLFAGFIPRVIKVAPACAVMISTYEFGKIFFQKMNLDRQQQAC